MTNGYRTYLAAQSLDTLRHKLCEAKYNPVVVIWEQHPNTRDNRIFSTRLTDLYFKHDPFQSVTIDTTPCWARSKYNG